MGPVSAFRLSGATALTCVSLGLAAAVALPYAAWAQAIDGIGTAVPDDSQMLLEADTLIYDRDEDTVTAVGSVRIDYGGNKLVAQRVAYNRKSGRILASGSVEIVDPAGTRVFSEEIDITDDFSEGFVNALRVETADKVYFGAESAQRRDGMITTFNNGVYTACAPCEDEPQRAPIWRIKSRKIIWNGTSKTVRFERARFEFFGFPLAQFPAFEIADPTVKRKSGFLFPGIRYKTELGVGVTVPYYLALSPTYDLLLRGTYFSKQGFLGEAEFRQRFNNGEYMVKAAGISQRDPDAFDGDTVDGEENGRGMIGTRGNFAINERWAYGWDILVQSDKNFSRTYGIEGFNQSIHRSEIYLVGLNDRNYFDLRFIRFDVQEAAFDSDDDSRRELQPWVLPTFDYAYTPDRPVFGGELNFDVNAQVLRRDRLHVGDDNPIEVGVNPVVLGVEGTSARVTAEAEWKRSLISDAGLVVTPLLHARAGGTSADYDEASADAIIDQAAEISNRNFSHSGQNYGDVDADTDAAYFRGMATAGVETRYPIIFASYGATHIVEPMAQLFVRPNEPGDGRLGLINEDAQSLVYDASTLFERDKFSGYDRIEGGTRANLGLRYSGSFNSGWTSNALFGQSYHLAGTNSFASPDLVNAGAYSGLETDQSDYVGMVGLGSPGGLLVSTGGRFDEETFEVRRAEVAAKVGLDDPVSVGAEYAFIQSQPLYGFADDRRELTLSGSTRFDENWRAYTSGTYDFESELVVKRSIGFAYEDECFTYALTYNQSRDTETAETSDSIGFALSLRTLGEIGSNGFSQ